jgi:glucosylglycerate phosphorylase
MQPGIERYLTGLYGPDRGSRVAAELRSRLDAWQSRHGGRPGGGAGPGSRGPGSRGPGKAGLAFDRRDAILITYADMVRQPGQAPLASLNAFLTETAAGIINTVHILPFYPWSSDDGFSVIDYRAVDPAVGTWADVERLGRRFRLMFDAVINHISAESEWFQAFLRGEPPYTDYFVTADPETDLSQVFRPRALPLLTRFETALGERYVWTTFSSDQVDLNYAEPQVLLEVLEVILDYVAHGARLLRLDAIAYLWKEPGTSSIHLPQTHAIIRLIRAVLDEAAPEVALVTETNVPHEENISYFGDGRNEAQMVYNFSLPPLTLHAFHKGDASVLSRWAGGLALPSRRVTFFNFLASHDGIGLVPARKLVPDEELVELAERIEALGGHISYRTGADGARSPYELNINYLDALGVPGQAEPPHLAAGRFLAAQAIMLALRGVPGIYFHSLFGSRGWREGVEQTGRARTVNREKLQRSRLAGELAEPGSLRRLVFEGYARLLKARKASPAFDPYGEQQVLSVHPAVFALARVSPDGKHAALCLHNVSGQPCRLSVPLAQSVAPANGRVVDAIGGAPYQAGPDGMLDLVLEPYGVLWLAGPETGGPETGGPDTGRPETG